MFHDTSKSAIADVAQLGLTRTQDEHEVESFWRGLKLDRYISGFSENSFDRMDVVMDMKVIHMQEIGMAAGHILKLLKGLSVLQHAAPKGSSRSCHRGPAEHCLHTEPACEQAVAKGLFCNSDAIKSSLGEDLRLTPQVLHVQLASEQAMAEGCNQSFASRQGDNKEQIAGQAAASHGADRNQVQGRSFMGAATECLCRRL